MILSQIERISAILQGKGYGSSTLNKEVSTALSLLGRMPSIFVDIGANKGNYTSYIIKKSPDVAAYLFEPSLKNQIILREKFSDNPKISVIGSAVGKERSVATLYSNEPGSGLASLSNRRLDHFGITMDVREEVSVLPFIEYWSSEMEQVEIDLVKIDVEGYEMDVLSGFGEAIQKTSAIQFEFGGCNIDTRTYFQDFWYFFKDQNFSIFRISPFGAIRIEKYSEADERFTTTNYVALRN